MHTFATNGVELAWDEWGSGAPLVLAHGFSGSAHDFHRNVPALSGARRVITLDHRGHGRSTKVGTVDAYSVEQIAADLIAFLDGAVGEPVDLLGHSMGGRVALHVVLDRPDLVRSLILMDTSAWSFRSADAEMRDFIDAFLASFDPAEGLPDVPRTSPEDALIDATVDPAYLAERLVFSAGFDPYAMKAIGRELFTESEGVRPRLGSIACPTTILVGEHDHPLVDQAPELQRAIDGSSLVVIPGAHHSPQLTHPDEWTAAVESHLARVAQAV